MNDVSDESRPAFRDRSTGLVIFGVIQLLIGIAVTCGLLGTVAASEMPNAPGLPRAVLTVNIFLYTTLALYFFSAGAGSIRKRRWARALSYVVSVWWLVMGIVSVVFTAVMLPNLKVLISPSRERMTVTILFGTLLIGYVAVPLVLVLFYRAADVKATCDAADERVRWTDRVPVPVLGLIIAMAFGSITLLASTAYAVIPVFGTILTGGPAILVTLALAILCGFLALQFYRLKRSAWWTAVLLLVIGMIAGPLTMIRTNLNEMYGKMGLLTPQIEAMRLADIYRSPLFWTWMGVVWIGGLAYLIRVRRYFEATAPRTRASDAGQQTAEPEIR